MSPALLSSRQTSQAETPPPVKTRPFRCAPLFLEPGTLLSEPFLFKISSKAMFAFPLPAGPPKWLFSLSAKIYAAPTLTSSRIRDLPKISQTKMTSNVIYKLRQLQMMASLLCGVMNPCHRPESASLSHVKLWTAF